MTLEYKPRPVSYMSIYSSRSEIHVHTQALRLLGNPMLIRFRINEDDHMILLEKVSEKDASSFWVPYSIYVDSKHYSFRFGCTKLTKEICGIMGWNSNRSYRIPGWLFQEKGFARFEMDKAFDTNHSD